MIAALLAATVVTALPAVRPLSAGGSIRDSLAGHERAVFSIDVPAETAARVIVEQQGIDVEITLRHAGSDLPEHGLDMAAGPNGVETRYVPISDAPMTWNVFVSGVLPQATRGDFTISFDDHAADDHDRAVAATRELYQETSDIDWLGATEKTKSMYEAVAQQAGANGDKELEAEATYQVARRHDVLGDVPGAIEWQKRALAMFRTLGRRDRESRALDRLGDYARKVGDIRESEAYFRDALPIARETGDRICEADILNNSAILMFSIGDLEDALQQIDEAIPISQELGSANVEVALWTNRADVYSELGMPDKAVESLERAVQRVKHSNLPLRRVGRSMAKLAEAYFDAGDRSNANAAMTEALADLEQARDAVYLGEALAFRGEMQRANGQLDRAGESFERAVPMLHDAQVRGSEASALLAWSELDADRGDFESALEKTDGALALTRAIARRDLEAKALYLRGRWLARAKRTDAAIESVSSAIDLVEAMRGSIVRTDLRTSYLTTVENYYDLKIDLLQQRGRTAEAFDVNERARARVLLESLATSVAKIRKGVDPDLLARERGLRAELSAKDRYRAQVALKEGETSPRAVALANTVAKLLSEWNDIRARIRETSPEYAALEMPEPVSVQTVQRELLDPHTAVVAYHLGRSDSYAWIVNRHSITVHRLPPAATIDKLAREYHDLLSRDIDAMSAQERAAVVQQMRTAGRRMFEAVWKPVANGVAGKRVLIIADGALQYVPFAALPTDSGPPLIARHEIVYLPSASVLEAIRRSTRPPAMRAALVVADPVFTADDPRVSGIDRADTRVTSRGGPYNRLRFSRREAEAIASVAGKNTLEALDFSASKNAIVDRDLRPYSIIHFATHGVVDTDRPELSGLVLSLVDPAGKPIDGFLHLYDIYNLNLDAQLVVLSACRTALGKEVHGEGLIGLTRGFMYAGAARVISSIWNVDDRASAQLMSDFYEAMLKKKMTPAAALRSAQLALLSQPRWSNPHYWAAFGLQGEWR